MMDSSGWWVLFFRYRFRRFFVVWFVEFECFFRYLRSVEGDSGLEWTVFGVIVFVEWSLSCSFGFVIILLCCVFGFFRFVFFLVIVVGSLDLGIRLLWDFRRGSKKDLVLFLLMLEFECFLLLGGVKDSGLGCWYFYSWFVIL